jgi:hypothetical protein
MSGECELQGDGIKVWAQMFFEDGSITRGIRMPAEWLDEGYQEHVSKVALTLLQDVNRDEGWLLIWGAGNMVFNHYPTSFSNTQASESDSSV